MSMGQTSRLITFLTSLYILGIGAIIILSIVVLILAIIALRIYIKKNRYN